MRAVTADPPAHAYGGRCPVCERRTRFEARGDWLRDELFCVRCGSIPRERAFAACLALHRPGWRDEVVHESSPAPRSISARMRREGRGYIGSQWRPEHPRGAVVDGERNEDLEALTFGDGTVDLHCHLDVMEHVGDPEAAFREMARTLRRGGQILFTTPIYANKARTQRRARYTEMGVEHLAEPEYHGNPIDPAGSLVTFRYGRDLPELIHRWAPELAVRVVTILDPAMGVLGEFRDVVLATKGTPPARTLPEGRLRRWAGRLAGRG
jgi:SAM-dependent methyltransferase